MNDKELFNEVLTHFVDEYHIEVERPYGDSYMVLSKDGKELGGINPNGYNLLHNLRELCEILKYEL